VCHALAWQEHGAAATGPGAAPPANHSSAASPKAKTVKRLSFFVFPHFPRRLAQPQGLKMPDQATEKPTASENHTDGLCPSST